MKKLNRNLKENEIQKMGLIGLFSTLFTRPSHFIRQVKEFNYVRPVFVSTSIIYFLASFPVFFWQYKAALNSGITGDEILYYHPAVSSLFGLISFIGRNIFFAGFYLFCMNFLVSRKESYINPAVFSSVAAISIFKAFDSLLKSLKTLFFEASSFTSSIEVFRDFMSSGTEIASLTGLKSGSLFPLLNFMNIFHVLEAVFLVFAFSDIYRTGKIRSSIPVAIVWLIITAGIYMQ